MRTRTLNAPPPLASALAAGASQIRIPIRGVPPWTVKIELPRCLTGSAALLADCVALSSGARPNRQTLKYPYRRSDVLRFREAWRILRWIEGRPLLVEYRDGIRLESNHEPEDDVYLCMRDDMECHVAVGRATFNRETELYQWEGECPIRWRAASQMPVEYIRHTYTIAAVRAEYLPEISEADALKCGVEPVPSHGKWCDPALGRQGHWTARKAYHDLWTALHGKRHLWESWTWVVDLERTER